VRLVAHPVRWRLLRELACSDRAVRELTALLDEPQSLVSYHLGQLRAGALVRSRRSSADGRDSYYTIDLAGCRAQLQAAGAALHPGLWLPAGPSRARPGTRAGHRKRRVLFLCTGNRTRSQIAEALLAEMSEATVTAESAGSRPKPLHPNAIRVMKQRGLDISANRVKHMDELGARRFDVVVTLCDRVKEVCPEFPSHPERVHWSVADPALEGANDRATLPAFTRLVTELETRIRFLLDQLDDASTRRSTHA